MFLKPIYFGLKNPKVDSSSAVFRKKKKGRVHGGIHEVIRLSTSEPQRYESPVPNLHSWCGVQAVLFCCQVKHQGMCMACCCHEHMYIEACVCSRCNEAAAMMKICFGLVFVSGLQTSVGMMLAYSNC
ncbi:unnamed protein product [Amaranthus hypochondriacus]